MKYILRITTPEIDITPEEKQEVERYDLRLEYPKVDFSIYEAVKMETYELLIHHVMKGDPGSPGTTDFEKLENRPKHNGVPMDRNTDIKDKPYISLERLQPYLYSVTFDSLPEDNGGESPVVGGCSSFVREGKLYSNLDWDYSNTADFIVRTKDYEGTAFIPGLNDGAMDNDLIAQLPYRIRDGVNNYGIKVATHILFNDWEWTGAGNKSVSLTRLPYIILSRVKSMATIAQDLDGVLENVYASEGLANLGYLLQVIVTDGTTSCALLPPLNEGQPYILQDIVLNPKMANFRWVVKPNVTRQELQTRPTGVERFNMMPCPLEDLRFTVAYENESRLSEFIGLRGTTKDSTNAQLEAIWYDAHEEYLRRERDGKTWHTMHSVIYGDRLESLFIQENYEEEIMCEKIDYASNEDIDSLFD